VVRHDALPPPRGDPGRLRRRVDRPARRGRRVWPARLRPLDGRPRTSGQTALQKALRPLFGARPVTFSAYGNPYQLWAGRPEIEPLGDQRYAITARGAGVPIALEEILQRFTDALAEDGALAGDPTPGDRTTLIATYLDRYRATIERDANRYRSRLRRFLG